MAITTISGGFDIGGDVAEATTSTDDELTEEEFQAVRAMSQLRQGHPQAAATAAIELVRLISRKHKLGITVID